jgi:acetolactate synthase-1/2/3 large subunit
MLLIAADTATTNRSDVRDIAQRDVVLPTGAGFEQARTPETTLADLATALRRAITEQRPVVFNVPADYARRDIDYWDVPLHLPEVQRIVPDPAAVRHAVHELASARRPVVLAGRGAIEARSALLRLAERIGAPLATTLKAKDLFRGQPFDMEVAGELAGPVTREILDSADLLISFGAALDAYTTRHGTLLAGKRLVVVDVEHRVVPEAHVTVRGDATETAEALRDAVELRPSGFRTELMAERLARQADATEEPATVLRRLDEVLPERRAVVVDYGRSMMDVFRYLHPGDPRAYVLPVNFGSGGMGMGAAVGAATGRPAETVVLACGDEEFLRGGQAEFATAARLGLDIIVMVYDHSPILSMARIAEALGGDGLTVGGIDDLDHAAKAIADRTRPLLIDLPAW